MAATNAQFVTEKMSVDQNQPDLIYRVIENKRLLRFEYKGRERVCEPHDYGIQNGIVRLHCWQIAGESSDRIPGWRLFDVMEMQDCEILDRYFPGNREIASGNHHRWDKIFIRVAPPSESS
jgi:hypothetical protein